MYRRCHRSITTPISAAIVEANMIAKYEGINKLKLSIITITHIINTKYVLIFERLSESNCETAKNINIAVIAKSNPNTSG